MVGRNSGALGFNTLGTRFEERRQKVSDKDFHPLSVTKNGILPQLETAAKTNDGDNRKLVKKAILLLIADRTEKALVGFLIETVQFHSLILF